MQDSNLRPSAPKADALPSCANSRFRARMSAYDNLRCGRGDPLFNATFLVAPLIIDGASVIHLKDVTVTCPLSAPSEREGERIYSTPFSFGVCQK